MVRFSIAALLIIFTSAAAAEIQIASPKDKLITFDEIVMLRGRTTVPSPLEIEGIPFTPDPDGTFSCGLVLKRGKNLIEIRGGGQEKRRRVLRLITYPDIEIESEGKKHWARGQIVYLSALGLIEGYPDGNFYPANPVTRGELAAWLAKAKGLPLRATLSSDPFFDTPKEHWRAPYVKAITDVDYLPPYSKEIFGIDDPLSRREAAEIIVRSEGLGIISKIIPIFRDVPKEERGAVPIYTARESGLIIGVSKAVPVYDPERALTRAEAAMLISRFASAQAGIRNLYGFESGYTRDNYCQLNVPPAIISFTAQPRELRANKTTLIKLRAEIASRANFFPLAKVKADLSAIGGMPDAEMFNDGTHGDEAAGDKIYSLNFSVAPKKSGEKILRVTATDQLGWESGQATALLILE